MPTSCADYSNNQPPVSQTSAYAMVYAFESLPNGLEPNGALPEQPPVEGPDGNLYGVTRYGGVNAQGNGTNGTVYRLSPQGQATALHSFQFLGTPALHGEAPVGSLIVGPDCALYGTTSDGWNTQSTVFRITLAGQLNYVAGFDLTTGYDLFDRLTLGSDGNFYGTATRGGAFHNQGPSSGTVFQVTPAGVVTVLASFDGGANGGEPTGGLIEGSDGFLYGMNRLGGSTNNGTVFKISKTGQLQLLWSFAASSMTNGAGVNGGLVEGADGNLYGTHRYGGSGGGGTIFQLTKAGQYSTVHHFTVLVPSQSCNCGIAAPTGRLVLSQDGNFYGVAASGKSGPGSADNAAVFRMTPTFQVTPVMYFPTTNGPRNLSSVAESSDGYLYGVGQNGGAANQGLVYRIKK